ncbi:COMM domain-containing protein 8-like [Xenia sp. Carnegie-2017]|uniref:COMM domain-containing protein 8-like n=1 Tax=Xenia sp. Carnegie-2017 TaxID=2897299 RepID=UPI001F03C986|nr:COMM domain-containing protein 8-like [Xenia sp. Carnegie-2017]
MAGKKDERDKGVELIEKCPKDRLEENQEHLQIAIFSLDSARWFSRENFEKHLDSLSVSKATQKVVFNCLLPRKNEIKLAQIAKTCRISQGSLKDFDWKVKLIMATDKLANMREPVLSLDLDIQDQIGVKQVSVEISKDELKEIITLLESANKVVMQLKG